MHKGIIEIKKGNIAISKGVVAYFYDITPINSLYTDSSQFNYLVSLFESKLNKIMMPGQLMILPTEIDRQGIIDKYRENFRTKGLKPMESIASSIIRDIAEQNKTQKFRYRIILAFVENRKSFEPNIFTNLRLSDHIDLMGNVLKAAAEMEELMYKELSDGLMVHRPSADETEFYVNYLAMPMEKPINPWHYITHGEYLEYRYEYTETQDNDTEFNSLFVRHLIVTNLPVTHDTDSNLKKTINKIQVLQYPVDTILKFDMLASKPFIKRMEAKEVQIKKTRKMHWQEKGFNSEEVQRDLAVAKAAIQAEDADTETRVQFQLMFRLRANTLDKLGQRYKNFRNLLRSETANDYRGMRLSFELGRQSKLFKNINPFDVAYTEYTFTTNLNYLAQFNWFGGLYIGEEKPNLIVGYTRPGFLPVFINPFAPIEGKSANTAPVTVVCGESGSGKSQLVNTYLVNMIAFYGTKVLLIDPKGDRYKLFEMFPDNFAQNLVLGGDTNQRGIFDPFINYESEQAIEQCLKILSKLGRAVNPDMQIDRTIVTEAYEKVVQNFETKKIKRITMLEVAKEMKAHNKLWANNAKSLSNHHLGMLFFADQDHEIMKFNLSYMFNMITFDSVPNLSNFNENDIDHQMFAILLEETELLINKFMRLNIENPKLIVFEEYSVFKQSTTIDTVAERAARLGRSYFSEVIVIDQTYSVFGVIRDQASKVFIGSIKSDAEIKQIISDYKLDNNAQIIEALTDKTKSEGIEADKQYRFLFIDYNNRKVILRTEFPTMFKEAFNTLKKEATNESKNQD